MRECDKIQLLCRLISIPRFGQDMSDEFLEELEKVENVGMELSDNKNDYTLQDYKALFYSLMKIFLKSSLYEGYRRDVLWNMCEEEEMDFEKFTQSRKIIDSELKKFDKILNGNKIS